MPTRVAAVLIPIFWASVGAAALAGCGGDDGLSRSEYIDEFGALCLQTEADIADLSDRYADVEAGSDEERARGVEQAAVTQRLTDGIKALRPPAELQAQHDELIGYVADVEAAAADGDLDAIAAASESAEQVITAMGIDSCT